MSDPRRSIPSVDALLEQQPFTAVLSTYARARVVAALRSVISDVRERVSSGAEVAGIERPELYAREVGVHLARQDEPSLRAVINATGVVLHTNLGRAPLPAAACEAMARAARGYSNLEFDLEEGGRGSRYDHCVSLLCDLTGADDALVVNNNAAALVLALNTMARGRGVAVSRGELVEIGGGFRIPDILERSGAKLVEVGSTNRTRVADFEQACADGSVAAILKVHRSNFRITGFTEEAQLQELAAVAKAHGIPLLHDLGSGLMLDAESLALPEEPRAAESLANGADVVAVSGDKLLGGPQAGLLLGGSDAIAEMRVNPLCRALRVDKVTLAGLEATLQLYRDPDRARAEIPTLRMLSASEQELKARATSLAERLGEADVPSAVVEGKGAVGGGTYPGVELSGWALALDPPGGADAFAARLRLGTPPVIARIADGRVLLDPRTVDTEEEDALVRRIIDAWAGEATP
jgi:L-seryl-tRNA(Ser) seleniumtransferase